MGSVDASALLLAVKELVRVNTDTRKKRHKCRDELRAVIKDLEKPRDAVVLRPEQAKTATRAIRLACWSCGRCSGI